MSQHTAQKRQDDASKGADIRRRRINKMVKTQRGAAAGTKGPGATLMKITETHKRPPRRLDIKTQEGQIGIWFPAIGTQVRAFWVEDDGDEVRGGYKGSLYMGKVTGLAWEKGDSPEFKVEYIDGTEVWHDVVDEAGTTVTCDEPELTTNDTPAPIWGLLGHGTRLKVEWEKAKSTRWHEGTVVARGEREALP